MRKDPPNFKETSNNPKGEGWSLNRHQRLVARFNRAVASLYAEWTILETGDLITTDSAISKHRRRMHKVNAVDAWKHMLKTGWVITTAHW